MAQTGKANGKATNLIPASDQDLAVLVAPISDASLTPLAVI